MIDRLAHHTRPPHWRRRVGDGGVNRGVLLLAETAALAVTCVWLVPADGL